MGYKMDYRNIIVLDYFLFNRSGNNAAMSLKTKTPNKVEDVASKEKIKETKTKTTRERIF